MTERLEGILERWESDLTAYEIPRPLHVTTFFKTDFTGHCLADAAINDGQDIKVEIEALALIPNHLACALVRQTVPSVPARAGKRLHITLATRVPWRPVQSNDLLDAMSKAQVVDQVVTNDATEMDGNKVVDKDVAEEDDKKVVDN